MADGARSGAPEGTASWVLAAEKGKAMSEDARSALLDLVRGYWKSQIVHALASLAIAECLAERSASLVTLSQKTGANADGLRRLLRGAASNGLVRAENRCLFAFTPIAEWLTD